MRLRMDLKGWIRRQENNQREEEEHRPSPRASFSLKAHDISASSLCVANISVRNPIIDTTH